MQDYVRLVAKKFLFKPFMRSGLSANQITILNLSTLGVLSIVLFFLRRYLAGLSIAFLVVLLDNVDGEIARATTGNTKKGKYLDTSLDWIYLMFLLFSISYSSGVLAWGTLSIIAITYGNWVQYNGKVNVFLPPYLGITPLLAISILLQHANYGIMAIAITQTIRTITLYRRSTWGFWNQ